MYIYEVIGKEKANNSTTPRTTFFFKTWLGFEPTHIWKGLCLPTHQPFDDCHSKLSTLLQFLDGVVTIGVDRSKRDKQVWEVHRHLNCILIGDVLQGGGEGGEGRGGEGVTSIHIVLLYNDPIVLDVHTTSYHGGLVHVSRAILLIELVKRQKTQRCSVIPTLEQTATHPSVT